MISPIEFLPVETLLHICKFLPDSDIARLSHCSRTLRCKLVTGRKTIPKFSVYKDTIHIILKKKSITILIEKTSHPKNILLKRFFSKYSKLNESIQNLNVYCKNMLIESADLTPKMVDTLMLLKDSCKDARLALVLGKCSIDSSGLRSIFESLRPASLRIRGTFKRSVIDDDSIPDYLCDIEIENDLTDPTNVMTIGDKTYKKMLDQFECFSKFRIMRQAPFHIPDYSFRYPTHISR